MYFNVSVAKYIDNYKIQLSFNDGKSGIVDLENYITNGDIFTEIRTPEKFRNFTLEFGTITWNNGEIDIAPETLYEKTTGEIINFDTDEIKKVG